MNEVEFIMDYTKATTKYLENQPIFGFSLIFTMAAMAAVLYGYIASVKYSVGNADFSEIEISILLRVSIVVGLMIFMATVLFLVVLSRQRHEIIQEKVFLEEMKELRAKKFDAEH